MLARILVVEDNPANLELMVYLLKAFGHIPLPAHDGEEGLEVARREVPDLILCDLQLPKMDGFELAGRLRSHPTLGQIPLVAVTALAMFGDRDKVLATGFDGYIAKPFDPESFVGQVEAFLQPSQLGSRPAAKLSAESPPAPPAKRARVLALDDSPANLAVLSSTLEPFGYSLTIAQSVQRAIALARKLAPDLIVSDVHVGRESGYDFIRAVKADPRLSQIPFIFLSSTVWSREDERTGLSLGADKFLLRPVEPEALVRELEGCLQKSAGK